jgi:hypothetical protein
LKLRNGRTPNHEKKPRVPAVQGGRPPLSQSLRPARPPEEGERGAGELPETLKGKVGNESKGEEKMDSFSVGRKEST